MKIYIKSDHGVDKNYENIRPKYAITKIVDEELSFAFTGDLVQILIDSILKWKQLTKCDFHHFDKDTSNNFSGNIYLIDKDAHGYLHNRSVEDKFFRLFKLYDRNVKEQGKHHDALCTNMWEILKWRMNAVGCMSNVVDILLKNREDIECSSDAKTYIINLLDRNFLSGSEPIGKITTSEVNAILNSSGIDYTKPVDATYVDNEVGAAVLDFLDSLEAGEFKAKMHKKSIEEIRKFILNNPTNRIQLSNDYDAGIWKHSS